MTKIANIPPDFPTGVVVASISGAHPKVVTVKFDGKYYAPGCSPSERYARWQICEDLAHQFVAKCRKTKVGKRADMAEVEILAQYLKRLLKMGWGTASEMKWVIRRAASLLCWPVPDLARENASGD